MATPEEVLEGLRSAFQSRIPSGPSIVRRAIDGCLSEHEQDTSWIKEHFSTLVSDVQVHAYAEYLRAEREIGALAFQTVFGPLAGPNASGERVLSVLSENFWALDRFFLGLTQGRRPRAGNAFEAVIKQLFTKLRYPFSAQAVINGQPDFVLPSVEHFRRNPPDCIIFTVKRTLRERWRQIVTEGTRGLGFFLATIDEDVAPRDLEEMLRSRIHLVMPADLKTCRQDYRDAVNVITFEQFFEFHLDPAMARWRASGAMREFHGL